MSWRSTFGVLLLLVTATCGRAADEKIKLTFKQDGKDLLVSTTVTVNNSSHALWTHSVAVGKEVHLLYQVFQNRDLFVRSQKEVKIEWRLRNTKKGEQKFQVVIGV